MPGFICLHCKFAWSVMKVEKFRSKKGKNYVYLCEGHLHLRDDDLQHMPWDSQILSESLENAAGTCALCKPIGASCMGF